MTVNWLMIEIRNDNAEVTYRNSFFTSSIGNAGVPPTKRETDLPVDRENVAELAASGRTQWKIENEAFNVMKTGGYNLE